jgi:hypothetical protein
MTIAGRAPSPARGLAMELDELTTIGLLKPGKREGVAIHAQRRPDYTDPAAWPWRRPAGAALRWAGRRVPPATPLVVQS